jgi:hypothetical protein
MYGRGRRAARTLAWFPGIARLPPHPRDRLVDRNTRVSAPVRYLSTPASLRLGCTAKSNDAGPPLRKSESLYAPAQPLVRNLIEQINHRQLDLRAAWLTARRSPPSSTEVNMHFGSSGPQPSSPPHPTITQCPMANAHALQASHWKAQCLVSHLPPGPRRTSFPAGTRPGGLVPSAARTAPPPCACEARGPAGRRRGDGREGV